VRKNIQQLFEEYMFECEYVQRLKPKTLKDYRDVFSLLKRLQPNISIETLTSHTMMAFFKQLQERQRKVGKSLQVTGVSKSTIITYWNKLNRFYFSLENKGYLQKNPLKELRRPHQIFDNKEFLDKEETEKILSAILITANNSFLLKRNLVVFYLFLFCGLRREELLQLQIRDIDLPKRILTVRASTSKVERTRQVPLHSQLILHLEDYLSARKKYSTPYLIVSNNRDSRLSQNGLKHIVNALQLKSGVNFHVHQLRHTFAVNFLNFSKNIAKLQQLLGHTTPAMTLHYTRCLPLGTMRSDMENMQIDNFI
jgi:integrase/recombinase XerD